MRKSITIEQNATSLVEIHQYPSFDDDQRDEETIFSSKFYNSLKKEIHILKENFGYANIWQGKNIVYLEFIVNKKGLLQISYFRSDTVKSRKDEEKLVHILIKGGLMQDIAIQIERHKRGYIKTSPTILR